MIIFNEYFYDSILGLEKLFMSETNEKPHNQICLTETIQLCHLEDFTNLKRHFVQMQNY